MDTHKTSDVLEGRQSMKLEQPLLQRGQRRYPDLWHTFSFGHVSQQATTTSANTMENKQISSHLASEQLTSRRCQAISWAHMPCARLAHQLEGYLSSRCRERLRSARILDPSTRVRHCRITYTIKMVAVISWAAFKPAPQFELTEITAGCYIIKRARIQSLVYAIWPFNSCKS
jgi:hypothetical protein